MLIDKLCHTFYVDNFQGTTSHHNFLEIYENAIAELCKANMPLRMLGVQ